MKWFKHDTNANTDAKLQEVLLDYGLEGYGLYWYCIELIAGRVDQDNINFDLEHDARIIARNTGSTSKKVEEMMAKFVELGLFENSEGRITCLKLAKRLDKSMTSNPAMRGIIAGLKNHDSIMTKSAINHDSIMTKSEIVMQDKIRLDENRLEDIREKPKAKRFAPPTHEEAKAYFLDQGCVDLQEVLKFVDFYESKGWVVGRNKMKDWKAAVRNWLRSSGSFNSQSQPSQPSQARKELTHG